MGIQFLMKPLASYMKRIAASRDPDETIGGTADDPYLRRWHLIPKNRWCGLYLHQFLRSDDDRALHSHPWYNASLLIEGEYLEVTPNAAFLRQPGAFYFRKPSAFHRVELFTRYDYSLNDYDSDDQEELKEIPVWTLFFMGMKCAEWGFACPQGFRHWKDFVAKDDKGRVGRGCD